MAFDPILYGQIVKIKKIIDKFDFSNIIKYQTTLTITANSNSNIDLSAQNIDGTKAIIEILVLDNDDTSDTYNTYINSEAVITKSISTDGTTLTIYNYDDVDRDILVKILYIG